MVTTTLSTTTRSAQYHVQPALQQVVDLLTVEPEAALARIWLLQSEDQCDCCRSNEGQRPGGELGLHLAASAGRSRDVTQPQTWNRLDGMSHRFPLRSQKIGRIGATGEPLIVRQSLGDASLTNPQWLVKEGIQSFFGYPIMEGHQIFGVLGVFLRRELSERDLQYLSQISNLSARLISDAMQRSEMRNRVRTLVAENAALLRRSDFGQLDAEPGTRSAASRKWDEQIRLAAKHDAPVLILGERGSGKGYTARRIHAQSKVSHGPFLVISGHELDIDFLEHHLSSTVDSSEPSADPDGSPIGTLFIKSIERTSAAVQNRLTELLAVQENSGNKNLQQSFRYRVIADSMANLEEEVASGRLLNDLYCALSIAEIRVPALRGRTEDLPALAKSIVHRLCEREQRTTLEIPSRLINEWKQATWPGNVRELEMVISQCVWQAGPDDVEIQAFETPPSTEADTPSEILRAQDLKRNEKANLLACLKQCGWKVYGDGGAAEMLGMKPTTLIYRMKILGIRRPAR